MEKIENQFNNLQITEEQIKYLSDENKQELQERQKAQIIIEKIIKEGTSLQKQAFGCVIGAFLGDSLGSYCEFAQKNEAKSRINKTMTMPGGGKFRINPAQLTDDSELALAQSMGIITGKGKLDIRQIAIQYSEWCFSEPFDIGITIGNAFSINDQQKASVQCYENAKKYNQNSLSNGCMMKITPLAIFCHKLSPDEIYEAVKQDIKLSHPNQVATEACYIWVQSLVDLINLDEIDIHKKAKIVYDKVDKWINNNCKEKMIQEWWEEYVKIEKLLNLYKQMGFMKIAWTYGFIFLKQIALKDKYLPQKPEDIYKYVMSQIIQEGGDTDTNACIVGGLMGALLGTQNIPLEYIQKQINCSVIEQTYNTQLKRIVKNQCIQRPICYSPYNGILNTQQILDIAPQKLEVINGNK